MVKILPACGSLELVMLQSSATSITAVMRPYAPASRCPLCGTTSLHVHSRYHRTLLDVPWCGVLMRLDLQVRRFFCDAPTCERVIFTERLP